MRTDNGQREICGTCKWQRYEFDNGDWVCLNPESEFLDDWVEYYFGCEHWEQEQGRW